MRLLPTFRGLPKIPARYAGLVTSFLLSIFMTSIVSLVSTLFGIGIAHNLFSVWLGAWTFSWVIAFPTLLFIFPLVRKLTTAIVDVAGPTDSGRPT